MTRRVKAGIASVVAAAAIAGGGVALAGATGGDDAETERPITGDALERASRAALATVPEGSRVTDTEAGDEESFYEVEVTLPDGAQIDVQLDRGFEVVGTEAEGAAGTDED